MSNHYPIFVKTKTRYYSYGFLGRDLNTNQWKGYLLIFPIPVNYDSFPIFPLLTALAVCFCHKNCIEYHDTVYGYHSSHLTDKHIVIPNALKEFRDYCRNVYLPAILCEEATKRGSK